MLLYSDTQISCSHTNISNIGIAQTSKFIPNIENQMHRTRAIQLKVRAGFKCCIYFPVFLNEMYTCTICSEEGLMNMAENIQCI